MTIRIRPATPSDAAAVTAIYNEGIRGRLATFETVERTTTEVAAWLENPQPFLVATREEGEADEVVGWVRASTYRPVTATPASVSFRST